MGLMKHAPQWLKDDRMHLLEKVWLETSITGQTMILKWKPTNTLFWTIWDTLEDACAIELYWCVRDAFSSPKENWGATTARWSI